MKTAIQNTGISINKTLNFRGRLVSLNVPRVMGILNVTPDSFFDGGRYMREKEILGHAEKMLTDGATFIDIGGYSSRPGAADIPSGEESRRAVQAIRSVIREFPEALLAIDTFRSEVASAAVQEGAVMINDISGGSLDPTMPETVARLEVPFIIMHMRGTPATMSKLTGYRHMVKEIMDYFHHKIYAFQQMGIKDIVIDPGFGFAKTVDQNFTLLNQLETFRLLGKPLLAGLSRKSMVWRTLQTTPGNALNGTTCLNTIAILKGASILRVHDVREAVEIIALIEKTRTTHEP